MLRAGVGPINVAILLVLLALVADASAGHCDGADVMSRFRMSPLGAAINLATVLAVVALWYWRRKKKALPPESATAVARPPSAP